MFAVVDIVGSQEKVAAGQKLRIARIPGKVGANVTFGRVLLTANDGLVKVGAPYLAGATVEAKVLSEGRGEKIRVFRFKQRKRMRKTRGHRQWWSEIEIVNVKLP
jgi:large subunit ribosomal protein L21